MTAAPGAATEQVPYLEGLRHGELRAQRCEDCGYVRHPARWLCPECLSERVAWQTLSGRGTVETYIWYLRHLEPVPAAIRRDVPYNVAVVALDEGPRLLANIDAVTVGELRVDQRVVARSATTEEGTPQLAFVPDDGHEGHGHA